MLKNLDNSLKIVLFILFLNFALFFIFWVSTNIYNKYSKNKIIHITSEKYIANTGYIKYSKIIVNETNNKDIIFSISTNLEQTGNYVIELFYKSSSNNSCYLTIIDDNSNYIIKNNPLPKFDGYSYKIHFKYEKLNNKNPIKIILKYNKIGTFEFYKLILRKHTKEYYFDYNKLVGYTGEIKSNSKIAIQNKHKKDFISFGNYLKLPYGEYEIIVKYKCNNPDSLSWDIVYNYGQIFLISGNLPVQLNDNFYTIYFLNPMDLTNYPMEFRIFYNGIGNCEIFYYIIRENNKIGEWGINDVNNYMGEKEYGYLIADKTKNHSGIIYLNKSLKLKNGKYRIKLNYSTDNTNNAIFKMYVPQYYNYIIEKELKLSTNSFEIFDINISKDIENLPIDIFVEYKRNGNLTINDLSIIKKPENHISIYLVIFSLLIFLYAFFFYTNNNTLEIINSSKNYIKWIIYSFSFSIIALHFQIFFFISLVLFLLLNRNYLKSKLKIEDYFIYGFIFSSLISGVMANNKWISIGCSLLFLLYYLICIYLEHIEIDDKIYTIIIKGITFSLLIFNIFALLHFFVIKQSITLKIFENYIINWIPKSGTSLVSFFEWSARGGYRLSILLLIVLNYLIYFWKKIDIKEKVLFSSSFIITLLTLFLTESRGGLILFTIASFIILFFNKLYKIFIIFILSFIIFLILTPEGKITQSIKKPLSYHTDQTRLIQFKAGIDMYKNSNKFFGIGLMNFRDEYNKVAYKYSIYAKADYLHNTYLAILLETGIFGFIFLFGFFILLFFKSLYNTIKFKKYIDIQNTSIIGAFLFVSLFDAMLLYAFPIGIFMWIILGLSRNQYLHNIEKIEI